MICWGFVILLGLIGFLGGLDLLIVLIWLVFGWGDWVCAGKSLMTLVGCRLGLWSIFFKVGLNVFYGGL